MMHDLSDTVGGGGELRLVRRRCVRDRRRWRFLAIAVHVEDIGRFGACVTEALAEDEVLNVGEVSVGCEFTQVLALHGGRHAAHIAE